MKSLDIVAAALLVIGGLNWGLWGLLEFDLVATIFGGNTAILSKVIYSVVGLAAIYQAIGLQSIQRRWGVQAANATS